MPSHQPPTDERAPGPVVPTALAAIAALLATGIYPVMAGTGIGRSFDRAIVDQDLYGVWEAPAKLLVFAVNPVTLGVVALALLMWGARSGRRRQAAMAAIVMLGAVGTTRAVEEALGHYDPLGVEHRRALWKPETSFYPSGHATAIMSVCLAAILVASPRRRRAVTLAAATCGALVGWGVFADASHHLSDVIGGFLVATAWAMGVVAAARMRSEGSRDLHFGAVRAVMAKALAATAVTGLALELVSRSGVSTGPLQSLLLLGSWIVAAAAVSLCLGFARVLASRAPSGPSLRAWRTGW